jgi:23S rRNA pseudouridine2605 synthase
MPAERLQKLLARAGVTSRRSAEELIAAGRVTVNDRRASVGMNADAARDRIAVDGVPLQAAPPAVYLALHKPRGYLSSTRDERGRRSVLALLPSAGSRGRLWPVGRLDVDSEGLMLLSNDGEWAQRVLHPRYATEREYAVLVQPEPGAATLRMLRAGLTLDDGPARLLSARRAAPPPEISRAAGETGAWLRVRVGEGRKREVRRLFAAAGHRTPRLARVALGPLTIRGLAPGQSRALDPAEAAALGGEGPAVARRRGRLAVAVDGPSGSGKSTIGHALAVRIGATFVDTGLMYRALTLASIEQGIDPDDAEGLGRLAARAAIRVRRPRRDETDRLETVLLGRRDVTGEVRTPAIDRLVSRVSRHAEVRRAMLAVQRATARGADTVMVGRDIGTVVLPDATLKVYLTASTGVRAARRAAEMGRPERAAEYLAEIERRDAADSGRAVAPLRRAPGSLVLDTGELTVEACVDAIVDRLPQSRRRSR